VEDVIHAQSDLDKKPDHDGQWIFEEEVLEYVPRPGEDPETEHDQFGPATDLGYYDEIDGGDEAASDEQPSDDSKGQHGVAE